MRNIEGIDLKGIRFVYVICGYDFFCDWLEDFFLFDF